MSKNGNPDIGRRSVLRAAGAAGAFLGLSSVVQATPGREPGPKEDEILVGTDDDVSIQRARGRVESAIPDDAAVVHENDTLGYMAVQLGDGPRIMQSTIDALERQPGIAYAERNETLHAFSQPNDPRFGSQYAPQLVNAVEAWDTTKGSMDVTIAVIDTGADYTHPDLADRFEGDEGYDFVDNDGDPRPVGSTESHGTHVCGCAAATTDNNEGTAGISNCHLISGRVLGADGSGSLSDIADGIQWAADQGADIINLSLGGGGATQTGRQAINYAYNSATLPIAAAGNSYGSPVSYPAAYENCMAVSAIDQYENIANFSNYGPNVNVAAPGVDVLAPVPGGGYTTMSGTSMASPVAAGVAALGKSAHPDLSVQELWDKLEETAVDIGLPENQQGAGRVDAANVVAGGGGGDPTQPSADFSYSPSSPEPGETITFDASASEGGDGGRIRNYEWDLGDGRTRTGQQVELSYRDAGEYAVSLTITDENRESDTTTETVTVGGDGGGGRCGAETESASASDYLSGGWWGSGSHTYSYSLRTSNPCEATISLDGPMYADFDLYVTTDGRTPTTWDFDAGSYSSDSQEAVTVDLSGGEQFGILVDSYSGSGYYTISVEEHGE